MQSGSRRLMAISQRWIQLDESIEKLQDNIDTTYESYSQAVTSTNIKNGEMQEEQKKVSQNSISQAQLSMENSKLTVEQAQENLDMYTIKATISGVCGNGEY